MLRFSFAATGAMSVERPHERFVPFVLRRNTLVADLERIEKEGKVADILIPLQAVQYVNM